jgi:acyl carrier protein
MPDDQVAAELHRLLERAGVDPGEVSSSTPLAALHLDSIDHAEMFEALHVRFGIEVDMQELAGAQTVGEAAELIAAQVATR